MRLLLLILRINSKKHGTTHSQSSTKLQFSTFKSKNGKGTLSFQATSLDKKWKIPVHVHSRGPVPTRTTTVSSSEEVVVGVSKRPVSAPAVPPILLIAGWAGVSMDWGSFPKMLAARTKRDVITYDARGLGNSKYQSSAAAVAGAGVGVGVSELKQEGDELQMEQLSLDLMAMDAIAVVNAYYEHKQQEEGCSASEQLHSTSTNELKQFCVGGVSMGGMVAQALVQWIHGCKDLLDDGTNMRDQMIMACESLNLEEYRISSLGLISSSPIRHHRRASIGTSVVLVQQIECYSIPSDHFLASFDDFHHEEKRKDSLRRFFQALGDDFLSKPGGKALQEKLISTFLLSRERFENGIGMESILAQRNVIVHEMHHIWEEEHCRLLTACEGIMELEISRDCYPLPLRNLDIPTIVVHGTKDSIIPFDYAEMLHSLATSGGRQKEETSGTDKSRDHYLSPIQNCSHFPWITNAHEIANILADFWSHRASS
jgi:pimeloyl-ACP methyl ester carboxylesterase